MPLSPGVPRAFWSGSLLPFQDCLVLLDVPALQHAACGGVMVMVQYLRLAEVHCMSSCEHVLCQSGCLDVPILQCSTSVYKDTLLEAPPSLANVHIQALPTMDGVHHPFAVFHWEWILWAYQYLAKSS